MKLVSGAFAGMEVFCFPNSKYHFTLKTLSNFNVIFKITLEDIPEFEDSIRVFLRVIYKNQNKILKYLLKKKQIIKISYDKILKLICQLN
jgi:hypothetical protein